MRPLLLCGVAVMLLAASPALAQSDAAKVQALKRYQEGVALHEKGHEEEAYLQFSQAYAVVQTPPILFNLARTEQLTGRHVDAALHLRAYLALPEHPRITKELRGKAQGYLTELNAGLGHLMLDVPAGAIVTLDGKEAAAGGPVDVEPGVHTVAARLGDQKGAVDVTVAAGASATAHVLLEGPKVAAVVTPVTPVAVAPVSAPSAPEPVKGEPYWNGRRTGGVVIAGVGVVGMVVGGIFGGARGGATSDANAAAAKTGSGASVPTTNL